MKFEIINTDAYTMYMYKFCGTPFEKKYSTKKKKRETLLDFNTNISITRYTLY